VNNGSCGSRAARSLIVVSNLSLLAYRLVVISKGAQDYESDHTMLLRSVSHQKGLAAKPQITINPVIPSKQRAIIAQQQFLDSKLQERSTLNRKPLEYRTRSQLDERNTI
jgi:hypothetical protein